MWEGAGLPQCRDLAIGRAWGEVAGGGEGGERQRWRDRQKEREGKDYYKPMTPSLIDMGGGLTSCWSCERIWHFKNDSCSHIQKRLTSLDTHTHTHKKKPRTYQIFLLLFQSKK